MKKILYALLSVILAFSSFFLFACQREDEGMTFQRSFYSAPQSLAWEFNSPTISTPAHIVCTNQAVITDTIANSYSLNLEIWFNNDSTYSLSQFSFSSFLLYSLNDVVAPSGFNYPFFYSDGTFTRDYVTFATVSSSAPVNSWTIGAFSLSGNYLPAIGRVSNMANVASVTSWRELFIFDHYSIRFLTAPSWYSTSISFTYMVVDYYLRSGAQIYDAFSFGFAVNSTTLTPSLQNQFVGTFYTQDAFDYWRQYTDGVVSSTGDAYYNQGYSQGETDGYNSGYAEGMTAGDANGYRRGYDSGYLAGAAQGNDYSFTGLFSSMFDSMINTFDSIFNFEFMGLDLRNLLLTILGISIIMSILRFVVK